MKNCAFCGAAARPVPESHRGETAGIAVLLGGKGEPGTRLGTTITQFVSEDEHLKSPNNLLSIA